MNMPASTQKIAAQAIKLQGGKLIVPDHPIIPFIEGDGSGPDIWRAARRVFDAAIEKAYQGRRKIEWLEVFAGQKSFGLYRMKPHRLSNTI
jgi:isocitrate dehydrogenase